MPKIVANSGVITQINVFEAHPGKEEALLELLKEATRAAREVPGWISASLHRSLEGKRVVNYAQCADMDAWKRIILRLNEGKFLERNKPFGIAHPGLYEVVFTLDREHGPLG